MPRARLTRAVFSSPNGIKPITLRAPEQVRIVVQELVEWSSLIPEIESQAKSQWHAGFLRGDFPWCGFLPSPARSSEVRADRLPIRRPKWLSADAIPRPENAKEAPLSGPNPSVR